MPYRDYNDTYDNDDDTYSHICFDLRESQRLGLSDTSE